MEDEEDEVYLPSNLYESRILSLDDIATGNKVRVLSFNARSINNKFPKIREITTKIFPEVLCIQETWGKNEATDYSIKGYHKPEFKVRPGAGMNLGGGVAVWVRSDTDYEVIKSPFITKEIETISILLSDLDLLVINVYRPFGDRDAFIETFMNFLDEILPTHTNISFLIVGDFNLDLLTRGTIAENLLDETVNRGFLQQVTEYTRQSNDTRTLIDHVYSKSTLPSRSDIIQEDLADHYLVLTTFLEWQNEPKKHSITKRWFEPNSYDNLKILLGAEDWSDMDDMNLDMATDHLISRIEEAMDIVAPIETREFDLRKTVSWMTEGLSISLKHSRKLYRKSKLSPGNLELYKRYKKILDRTIKAAKNKHLEYNISDAGNDTRRLWSILNEVIDRKQCRHKMPNRFQIDGKNVRDKLEIANAFNSYFASIGEEMANSLPTVPGYEEYIPRSLWNELDPMLFRPVDEEEVMSIMKKQQPKLSSGIDTINNKIVKKCHRELAVPMTKIINLSMTTGKVPAHFKKALIKPLYKKGAANQRGNYRPVSLLPSLSKILEKAVCQQLNAYMEKNQTLCQSQYGFRVKNQTTHVVHNLLNFLTEKSIRNETCIATFIDLSKAFDCLQYDKLFLKLKRIGLHDNTTRWFEDYLTNRQQQVEINGHKSEWLDVKLGVPQGSILGPVLFLIYVNDINKCNDAATFTKFADDTTILTSGASLQDAADKMNTALKDADLWFKRNKLNLNPSKTRYMIFNCNTEATDLININNCNIERVWTKGEEKSFKLVGLHVDEKLTWNAHIDAVARKMDYANYALRKSSKELNQRNKKLLYSGLIHSILTYGLPIWGFARQGRLNKLLVKQKHSIRKIHNLKYRDHTLKHFVDDEILQLPELIKYTTLCYTSSGLQARTPFNVRALWKIREQNRADLRDKGIKLDFEVTGKQWINNLLPTAGAKLWNNTEIDSKLKITAYKKECKTLFLDQYRARPDFSQ